MDKQKIAIITLAVGLFLIIQYFLLDKWLASDQQQKILTFQQGYNQGVRDVAMTLYKQTENCSQATITVGNQSKILLNIACMHNPKTSTPQFLFPFSVWDATGNNLFCLIPYMM